MLTVGCRRGLPPVFAWILALCIVAGMAACDQGGDADGGSDGEPEVGASFAQGRDVYRRCVACHVASAPENKVGPHLVGMFGRVAGSLEDFRYSQAMRESGIVWTEETLAAFLRDPRRFMPGNRMAFAGIRREGDLSALMVYLRQVTEPE